MTRPDRITNDRPWITAGDPLTPLEVGILSMVANGNTNGAIGNHLGRSEDTVKTHMRMILRKLAAKDRAHAVLLGIRTGQLPLLFDTAVDHGMVMISPQPRSRQMSDRHIGACFAAEACPCRHTTTA